MACDFNLYNYACGEDENGVCLFPACGGGCTSYVDRGPSPYTDSQGGCCEGPYPGWGLSPYNADALNICGGTCDDSTACGENGSGCLYMACDGTCTSPTKNCTDPNGIECLPSELDRVGWCNGPCTQDLPNPLPTLDGLRCTYQGDCGGGYNGRCYNNCLYKDCAATCNDEGPNDGGRDDYGTCCSGGTIGCDGVCNSGKSYDALNICGGTCYDSSACDEDWSGCLHDFGCGCNECVPDALNHCEWCFVGWAGCNDFSACDENANGCLYTNCDQTCTSSTPNPNCGGGGSDTTDTSTTDLIYGLIGIPWMASPLNVGRIIGLPPFIKL